MLKKLFNLSGQGNADKKSGGNDNAGILWGGGYNPDYSRYEKDFPHAYPYTRTNDASKPRFVQGTDGYWYNPDENKSNKAVILCTGDLMCEPKQHNTNKYGDEYIFHPSFKYVRDLMKSTDFVVGNLETTVTDVTPYAGEWHRVAGKYHCNAPKSYLDALRYAGFDAFVNANNHNCDSAVQGLVDTINALDEKQFMHTGTFLPESNERVLLVKINGIRVGILSYATYFNKLDANFTQLGKDALLNEYSEAKAISDVKLAREAGAEFVISYIHWGKEYTHSVSDAQKTNAQQLADAGVDYIVGSHSHCLQPHDYVTAKDGRRVPVVYSMGNFVTNEVKNICKHTGILQLVLVKKDGKVVLEHEYFIPCYVFTTINQSKYAVVPTDMTVNGGISSETLRSADKYIREVMNTLPVLPTAAVSIKEICEVLGAEIPAGLEDRYASRLCSQDSNVTQNSVFMGIIWNTDERLQKAVKNGACAVITDRKVPDVPCIVVDDVKEAYCRLYAHLRSRFDAKSVVITGSAGKSATKEILDNIFYDYGITLSSKDNWNTRHSGMVTMQKLRGYHEYFIQEVHEGDADSADMMSRAIMPDYAVITNIDTSHRENFGSQEAFVRSITDVVNGLKPEGVLFVNGDDAALMEAVGKLNLSNRVVTFGLESGSCDYKASAITGDGETTSFDIIHHGKSTHITFRGPVKKNAYNILAAFAVGYEEGIPEEKLAESIAAYKNEGLTSNVINTGGLKLMLDCRAPSVSSMIYSLEAFSEIPVRGSRVAVLGDVHLIEDSRKAEHSRIGHYAAGLGLDYIYCYGPESKHIYDAALADGFDKSKIFHFEDKRQLELSLNALLKEGDALLIKAGRRMYLNSTVRKLFGITFSVD